MRGAVSDRPSPRWAGRTLPHRNRPEARSRRHRPRRDQAQQHALADLVDMLPCANLNISSLPHCGQQRRGEDLKEDPRGEEEKEHQLSRYAGRPFSKPLNSIALVGANLRGSNQQHSRKLRRAIRLPGVPIRHIAQRPSLQPPPARLLDHRLERSKNSAALS